MEGYEQSDKNLFHLPRQSTVAEYYINRGEYVAFLQEKPGQKRADLSVGGKHTEVKGMTSTSTNKVAHNIKEAFEQVTADDYRYSSETHRDGRVVILSKYPNVKTAYKAVFGGYSHVFHILPYSLTHNKPI